MSRNKAKPGMVASVPMFVQNATPFPWSASKETPFSMGDQEMKAPYQDDVTYPDPDENDADHSLLTRNIRGFLSLMSSDVKEMKSSFGTMQDFLSGMFFGTIAPFVAQMTAFAFETTQLNRMGTLFGSAHFFISIGATALMLGIEGLIWSRPPRRGGNPGGDRSVPPPHNAMNETSSSSTSFSTIPSSYSTDTNTTQGSLDSIASSTESMWDLDETSRVRINDWSWALLWIGISFFLVGMVLRRVCQNEFYKFLKDYEKMEKSPHEMIPIRSDVGTKRDFRVSLASCIVFPLIGGPIRLYKNRSLLSKYGITLGLSWHLIILGLINPPFLIGGFALLQAVEVHFERSLICAGVPFEQPLGFRQMLKQIFSRKKQESTPLPV